MKVTELDVLIAQLNTALGSQRTEEERRLPHVLMRPDVFADGDQWCALYGRDIQVGVCGFGNTAAQACHAFDVAWNAASPPKTKKGKKKKKKKKKSAEVCIHINDDGPSFGAEMASTHAFNEQD